MKMQHWIFLGLILIGAYLVGVKYPTPGQSALSKIGM
jgi:hypothetical protein